MPELNDDEEEIRRSNVKNELKNIFMKYREKNCDKSGNILKNNLDAKQLKAIKEIKTKLKTEGLVCYKTDKTGKSAIDTIDNYATKMEKNIENDAEITLKKVTTIENKLNDHMEHWIGMTNAGELHVKLKGSKANQKQKRIKFQFFLEQARTTK